MSSKYVTLECELCGSEYERHASQADDSRYCSVSCKNGFAESADAEDLVPRYSDKWDKNRERALERDDFECQECGCAVGPTDEPDTEDAEVHHIKPWGAGGTHDLENLKTLCLDCHNSIH